MLHTFSESPMTDTRSTALSSSHRFLHESRRTVASPVATRRIRAPVRLGTANFQQPLGAETVDQPFQIAPQLLGFHVVLREERVVRRLDRRS